jgi:hypothetical protein
MNVNVGDGIRILKDNANFTRCKEGDLLIIKEILENGNWVTQRGWYFFEKCIQMGLIAIVPKAEIPEGYEEPHRHQGQPAFRIKAMEDVDLNKESIDAGAYYIAQKFDGAPLEQQTLALNSCSHGFFMGYRAAEKKYGIRKD